MRKVRIASAWRPPTVHARSEAPSRCDSFGVLRDIVAEIIVRLRCRLTHGEIECKSLRLAMRRVHIYVTRSATRINGLKK